jgi:hypothetical protein
MIHFANFNVVDKKGDVTRFPKSPIDIFGGRCWTLFHNDEID